MHYAEDFEQAESYAAAALSFMRGHRIPAHPKNFTIWYAYFARSDPDLSRILDDMIESGAPFTESVAADIYGRFFEADLEIQAIRQTGAMIEASVNRVLAALSDAGDSASTYGRKLASYSGELQGAGAAGTDAAGAVRAVIDNILSETQKMRARSEKIAGDLEKTTVEIVDLKRSIEHVRREAHTDSLTGIANRRSFDLRLKDAAREASEYHLPLSLLLLDVDHFKKFNDTYGHPLGDKVLQLVARILTDLVKGRDTVARYGGEEFAIILPSTGLDAAAIVADQVRAGVAARRIVEKSSGEEFGSVTLSVGAAEYEPGEPLDALIARADRALYTAKQAGRNRVKTESDVPPERAAG